MNLTARWNGNPPHCSWCDAETSREPQPGDSHGICARHRDQLLAEALADAPLACNVVKERPLEAFEVAHNEVKPAV